MNKILTKLFLSALIFSTVPMQAIGISSGWNKHGFCACISLYTAASIALTYACYKDMEKKRVKGENFSNEAPAAVGASLFALGVYGFGIFKARTQK